jgi:hypothetical protein
VKRESKLLLEKATDSLVLSIEFFNRPHERGRVSGVLILLDHAFEMFLKAAILHKGGRIREKGAKETIGFDACVRRALSDGDIKFLKAEQALTLQTINGLRDAAQHHLLDIAEGQLYVHVQSGVTLFRDLLKSIFGDELVTQLPTRVLPVSTTPPTDLATLFDAEVAEIKRLLRPGKRRGVEARARLRPLAILDATIRGEKGQPSTTELHKMGKALADGGAWEQVFQGVAAVEIRSDGSGPALSLRLSKKEGLPIQLVPEGTPGAATVAVKRVDELGFYSLGAKQLAKKVRLTMPKTVAVVDYLNLRGDAECYKEFRIGKTVHKRYSQKAISRIESALEKESVEEIWDKHRGKKKKRNSEAA